jgi:hypothetical protein
MTGQIGEAHHVLDQLSNLFVSLVPRGTKINVQVAKEEGDMPARAFVPGLFDRRQRA